MQRSTKLLLCGVFVAALVAGGGYANTIRLESKVQEVEEKCIEESKRELAKTPRVTLLCDANELARLETDSKPTPGVQGQVISAYKAAQESRDWPLFLAAAIALISAMPWGWYFFLRRVSELRDAIVGKKDA